MIKKNNNILIIVFIVLGILLASYLVASSGILTGFASRANQPQCRDGIDNDRDGKTDYPSDTGCYSKKDASELGTLECDDGKDNDLDRKTDFSDTGCSSSTDNDETNCGDGKCEETELKSCSLDCKYTIQYQRTE